MTSVVPPPAVARVLLLATGLLNAALAVLVAAPLPRVPLLVLAAGAITSWGLLLLPPGL
ncbi:hypothetical protein G3I28_18145, partial [Streptomyces sp. SID10116]|nr:hypothetical protein [Streptomyces sp. SID10116]